jgi:hypothetical protein
LTAEQSLLFDSALAIACFSVQSSILDLLPYGTEISRADRAVICSTERRKTKRGVILPISRTDNSGCSSLLFFFLV